MNGNRHSWYLQDAGFDIAYLRAAPDHDGDAPAILERIAAARAGGQHTQSHASSSRLEPVSDGLARPTHAVREEVGAGAQQPGVHLAKACADRHDSPRPETGFASADNGNTVNLPSPGTSTGPCS